MKIIYAGWISTRLGKPDEETDHSFSTVSDLLDYLPSRGNEYKSIFQHKNIFKAWIDGKTVPENHPLSSDSIVTLFAPMSGG